MSYALLLAVHLLAAAFWVGGMAVMNFAVRPAAAATLEPAQRLPFMAAALARFFAGVTLAIALLLGSGLVLIALGGGFGAMPPSVHLMFGVGLTMIVIFGWIRLRLFVQLRAALDAGDRPRAAAALDAIRRLVATNLALGSAVFVIAVAGRAG
ncbi:MAG: CopD family protein [Burkholderiales bacterium]|nr:CopD family protein [Burkholderiales bacterium]